MTKNESAAERAQGRPRRQLAPRLAVARSLDSARARAENRLQRFLDAALELMKEGEPGKDFTVQEVVERSGQSLRLFYQYFGGKHELLLALFEESVRSDHRIPPRADRRRGRTPSARLHRFVVEYYRLCRPTPERRASLERIPNGLDDGGLRSAAAHQPSARGRPGVRPARHRCSARCSTTPPPPAPSGRDSDGARLPGWSSKRSCSTRSRRRSQGTSIRPEGADPAEELWDLDPPRGGRGGPAE